MFISIGNQTRKYMNILELSDYPFTEKQIKENFRRLIKVYHTDTGGDKKTAQSIIEAYNAIKNLALSDILDETIDPELQRIKKEQEKDIFALYKDCPECKGNGKRTVHHSKVGCSACNIDIWWGGPKRNFTVLMFFKLGIPYKPGLKLVKCNQCNYEGKFTLKSGRKVVCRNCKGKKWKVVTCYHCSGTGSVGEEKIEHINCFKCNGTGKIEIKPFNPVIPKGAVL